MTPKTVAVLPAQVRPHLEGKLPGWLDARWFNSREEACALAPEAVIGWFDMSNKPDMAIAVTLATRMKWLNSGLAGMDGLPLDELHKRSVAVTNGAGINAITIAEYVVMGMLNIAKSYREVVKAQERHEWLRDSPGKMELSGSHALMVGYGAIGKLVEERLNAFGVKVTAVRRNVDLSGEVLGPGEWQERLGEFDWIILAVPATSETKHLIGVAELARMKPAAVLMNFARGSIIDQDALLAAMKDKRIAAAFLDVTDPEPLPADHPLWSLDNVHISMHLSGRSQTKMFERASERFLENLTCFQAGRPLQFQVDLKTGY
ncbi:MAG: D-2-hydroxyacid dehydrogenase [Pseudomonadota bacterium]